VARKKHRTRPVKRKAKHSLRTLKKASFSKPNLIAFILVFAAIGGYIIYRSFAATIDCGSYPSVPAGTASINLCATSVDHTLPAKFWGYGMSRYFSGDLLQPQYQQLFKQVGPEVFRNQEGMGYSPGTPASPDPFLGDMRSFLQTMKSQGLDMGAILMMESGPASLPSGIAPATISNYDQTGTRSPQNHGAMVNWFMDGGIDVLGYEAYNEPANDSSWYTGTTQTVLNTREAWAYIHQRQFSDGVHQALSAKGRSVKILGGVLGTGEGYGANWAQVFFSGNGTIISDGGGWPWPNNNLASTASGPIFDTYDFHPYPANRDPQSGVNSLVYPTLTTNDKSSLYAFMETTRNYLNANNGSGKQLAFDEGGFDLNTNVDALAEGVYAVVMSREQAHWNVPFYTLWSANTTSAGGTNIWPLFLTSDHVNFRNTVRSSMARDITGKFMHNYKRQITGYASGLVAGSGMTPGGAYANPVQRIQATAGLSADGTKMAVLAANLDLANPQPFQINFGTTASGPITATYMLQTTPAGNMPTATISAGTSLTRTLEPGSIYLFEIPIGSSSTPVPTASITANPTSINTGASSTLSWNSSNATACTASGAWSGTKATSGSLVVSPTATGAYTLVCTGAGGSATASATITVTAVSAPPGQLTAATVIHKTDGILDEPDWNISTPITKVVSGTTGNSGTWGALWDKNYLYVGVKVSDSSLSTTAGFSPVDYWHNDSVEVYVDPNADGGTTYDSNDKQLAQVWNDIGLYGISSATPGVLHAWAPISGGYSVEMAIPWSSLGVAPVSGASAALDIGINDAANGSRVGQLIWHGTANDYKDPSGFGLMSLSGTPTSAKTGDINGDGSVDIADLSILLSNFGTSNAAADLNKNGVVDIFDLSILVSNYGA